MRTERNYYMKRFYFGASFASIVAGVAIGFAALGGGGAATAVLNPIASPAGTVAPAPHLTPADAQWSTVGSQLDAKTGAAPSGPQGLAQVKGAGTPTPPNMQTAFKATLSNPVTLNNGSNVITVTLPAGAVTPSWFSEQLPTDAPEMNLTGYAVTTNAAGRLVMHLTYDVSGLAAPYAGFTMWMF